MDGLNTSISLEDEFWVLLRQMAEQNRSTTSTFIELSGLSPSHGNLSSFLRLLVLEGLQKRLSKAEAEVITLRKQLAKQRAG